VLSPADFYRLTGNRLDHHYTLPKILWLRKNRPAVYRDARWWLNTKDYLYGWLTGRFGFTDFSDASLTIALDIENRRWAGDLLRELDVDVTRMPEILPGHDVSGRVRPAAARETGLLIGTPVAMGGGDGACAARGAGLHSPGSAYSCIGSSAWVSQLTEHPMLDPGARVFNYLDMDGASNHVCGTVQCGAEAYDWAVKHMLVGECADTKKSDAVSRAENMARQVPAGAEGVIFLPTLMGERTPYWDANTRGCILGFTLYHNRSHVARALYEGVAYALFSCAEVMRELGVPVESLMLTGGGANSGLWPDIMASVFGVPAMVHAMPGESTSLGAAIAAGVGVGLYEDYHQGAKAVRARSTHVVNPAWAEKYRAVYPIYAKMYDRLKPLFDDIAALS
jgi:xylulokinase